MAYKQCFQLKKKHNFKIVLKRQQGMKRLRPKSHCS